MISFFKEKSKIILVCLFVLLTCTACSNPKGSDGKTKVTSIIAAEDFKIEKSKVNTTDIDDEDLKKEYAKLKDDDLTKNKINLDSNNSGEKTEFFDETIQITKNKNKNSNSIDIEHNPLISQFKSNPFEFYESLKFLGEGSFAKVYLVKNKSTGAIRAMKEIRREQDEDTEINIINEINILMKLDHPNIVKIFEFYVSERAYYLITEYCPGGSLFDFIDKNHGPFTEIQASYIMHQLFSVVNYCHKMKIIHRDLKPENILINKNDNGFVTIKVCDFGTSLKFKKGDVQDEVVGSIYYIAPEVLKKNYNAKCDI